MFLPSSCAREKEEEGEEGRKNCGGRERGFDERVRVKR